MTWYALLYADFLLYSFGYLFEGKFHAHAYVASFIDSLLPLTAAKSATESAETTESATECSSEKIVQYVIQIAEPLAEVRRRSVNSCMSELVVLGLLVCVAENGISLGSLLEFLFGFLVSRILVRMIFDGQFPVCLLYFIGCRVLLDAQHLVVVSLTCHNYN